MAENYTDSPYLRKLGVLAEGQFRDTQERNIEHFDPTPFSPTSDIRPVSYVPVKRRNGKDDRPEIALAIRVFEDPDQAPDASYNFDIPKWAGAMVEVTVTNIWPNALLSDVILIGVLDDHLSCAFRLPFGRTPDHPVQALAGIVNENLFEFHFTVDRLDLPGCRLSGSSVNRAFFYRKKTIVFLPGLFASQFLVKYGGKRVAAYPNFFVEGSSVLRRHEVLRLLIAPVTSRQVREGASLLKESKIQGENVGWLEADDKGIPLLEAEKPELLRFDKIPKIPKIPQISVADFHLTCHAARNRRLGLVPNHILLYNLWTFCYDWRGDLTDRAAQILRELAEHQRQLQDFDDTDDQVAIAGHSTGGVIIRRMLHETSARDLFSHTFFIDVPFRGAPKALSMVLTGCDSPGGENGIPFIDPASLVDIALTEPVVYHLSPSAKYPEPPVVIEDGQGDVCVNVEDLKAKLIRSAVSFGLYYERSVVKQSLETPECDSDDPQGAGRAGLAVDAGKWYAYSAELAKWERSKAVYRHVLGDDDADRIEASVIENARNKLGQEALNVQSQRRAPMGWNEYLAERARKFHEKSEKLSAEDWSSKIYVFYSKGHDTTMQIKIEKIEEITDCPDTRMLMNRLWCARFGEAQGDGLIYDDWGTHEGTFSNRVWKLSAVRENKGDGTVPTCSQLGVGIKANVFYPLPGCPKHMDAPNSQWLWNRIIDVLQGVDVKESYLISEYLLSTETGMEWADIQPAKPD